MKYTKKLGDSAINLVAVLLATVLFVLSSAIGEWMGVMGWFFAAMCVISFQGLSNDFEEMTSIADEAIAGWKESANDLDTALKELAKKEDKP